MKASFKTVLLCFSCSIFTLAVYHYWHKDQIIEIEENYSRLVSQDLQKSSQPVNKTFQIMDSGLFVEAADHAKNAVVSIKAVQIKGNSWRKDKYSRSNGSGVIIDSEGYVVTNYHVVEDADILECTLEDKREFKAELIAFDRSTDIALLKIEASSLTYLEFGDSNQMQVGEWVLAVGNPFKLQSSVTAGIISAKARNLDIFNRQGIESFIQTDAAINPGNSGGALINTEGYLIGINTAILTYSGKYEGFSFAIPSSIVKKVVYDLRKYGAVQRAWLGVGVLDLDHDKARTLDLDFIGGAMIDLVEKEGSASEAGMRSGDVIVKINDKSTLSVAEFLETISQYSPGDKVTIDYYRDSKMYSTNATLKNQLNTTDYIAVRKDKVLRDLGFELRDLDSKEKSRLNTEGVMVVSVVRDSKIGDTNMDPNYIITSVNGVRVKNVDALIEELRTSSSRVELKGFYENWPGDYPYIFTKK